MKQSLLFLGVSFFLPGCQKEFTNDMSTSVGNVVVIPTNTCETYFPLTTGSTWTYEEPAGIEVSTITSPDTILLGNTFKRITQSISGDVSNSFYREENGNVYAFLDLSTNRAANGKVFINPLRSNAAVGDEWRDTIVINNSTERLEYEMMQKNISYQVDTFYFSNVEHVQYTVRLDLSPILLDQLVQITDVWYAECVGVVQTKSQFLVSSAIVGSPNKLKSYSIH